MGTVRSYKVFHPYTSESEIPIVCGVPEMCRIFQRSEPTIRGWCRDGKLPAFHIGDLWFANKSDLLNLVGLQKQNVTIRHMKKGEKMVEYKEIFKLKEMLEKANIPIEFVDHSIEEIDFKGYQICYPVSFRSSDGRCVCSIIEHLGSYGSEKDLLEIMGLLTPEEEQEDIVKGWLTAENVFERIKNHYEEIKSGKHRDTSI